MSKLKYKQASKSIAYKVKVLSQLIGRRAQAELQPYGLTPFHMLVLSCLAEEDHLPATKIADRLNEVGATMTGVLDRMEEKGLLTRSRDTHDRRVWRISLTTTGKKLYSSLPDIGGKIREELTSKIAKDELAIFESVLAKLIENAEQAALKCHPRHRS